MDFERLDTWSLVEVIMSVLQNTSCCSVISKILRCLVISTNKRTSVVEYLVAEKTLPIIFTHILSSNFSDYKENSFIFLCFFAILSRNTKSIELYMFFFDYQDYFVTNFMIENDNKTVILDIFFSFLYNYPTKFYNFLNSYVVCDTSLLTSIIKTSKYSDKVKTLKIIHLILTSQNYLDHHAHLYNILLENDFIST